MDGLDVNHDSIDRLKRIHQTNKKERFVLVMGVCGSFREEKKQVKTKIKLLKRVYLYHAAWGKSSTPD